MRHWVDLLAACQESDTIYTYDKLTSVHKKEKFTLSSSSGKIIITSVRVYTSDKDFLNKLCKLIEDLKKKTWNEIL